MTKYRIRRCDGNRKAWLLVRLNADGTEADGYHSYWTAMTIDGLFTRAERIDPDAAIELVWRAS